MSNVLTSAKWYGLIMDSITVYGGSDLNMMSFEGEVKHLFGTSSSTLDSVIDVFQRA